MKWLSVLTLLISAVVGYSSVLAEQDLQAGKKVHAKITVIVKTGDKEESVEIRYLLFLPQVHGGAEKKDVKWPLTIFLHGAGERGNNNLDLVKKHGPPKIVEEKPDFPFITVSPQCPEGKRWNPQELAKLVDALANTHAADSQNDQALMPND